MHYEETCLPAFLEQTAARYPERMALVFQGYKVTFRQLTDMVDRFAAGLHAFGIGKGDSVAILLPNTIPCVAAYFGILKLGAIAVMNNPLYTDRELEHQFNDSSARALITLDLLANRMAALRAKTGIKEIIYTTLGDYLPFPKNLLFPLVAKKKKLAADVKPGRRVCTAGNPCWPRRQGRRRRSLCPSTTLRCTSTPAAPPGSPKASC
ncbi:MAG: AMP-binding protein [Desulfobacterales bacterium]|nr:AMP-binding protein [Desulfobacterales bacterium]